MKGFVSFPTKNSSFYSWNPGNYHLLLAWTFTDCVCWWMCSINVETQLKATVEELWTKSIIYSMNSVIWLLSHISSNFSNGTPLKMHTILGNSSELTVVPYLNAMKRLYGRGMGDAMICLLCNWDYITMITNGSWNAYIHITYEMSYKQRHQKL